MMSGVVPGVLPDIDFARIRPYGQPASRAGGFEELASILIEQGVAQWPDGVRFERFGNPDGGREGQGVLPGRDVWAWQVKYLFEFDASAVSQVASSVHRVLDREPRLKRYFVALPIDLPAGDTDPSRPGGRKLVSAHTRWTEAVREWEEAARAKGMEVEFVLVNAHALLTALTEPRHAGRARYWFGVNAISPQWQKDRVGEAIAKAGRRYTPRVHVAVEAGRALDAVGRTGAWVQEWQRALAELRATRRWPWRAPEQAADAFAAALPRCASALDDADTALASVITAAGTAGDLPDPEDPLRTAQEALNEIDELLHRHAMTEDRHFTGDAASLYTDARKAAEAIGDSLGLARSALTRSAAEKVLLLTGRAGVGKTHLLCDAARRRIDDGKPTILLLGQDFDARSLLAQAGELSQLGATPDDLLSILDAASEAAGCTGLLMIDALNESERPDRWPADVRALVAASRRYPHVALVLSCRSEFTDEVVGDKELPRVEHFGFAEATDDAIMRFTREYGLEPPTFPALNPEFSNPLYLKLTCEALHTLGATRFRFGTAGLTTVTSAFIEAVNLRLSEPGRCNYDKWNDLAGACVRQLAELGSGPWHRADVQRITEGLLPGRGWSSSLLKGLTTEGILIELHNGRIAFGYQRLGDIARASVIAEKDADGIRDWLKELGDETWSQRGVLGALAVIVPERHGAEIIDLDADEDGGVSDAVIDSFIESLLLRSPESVTPRTVALVEKLLAMDYRVSEVRERLVRIACVPGHPLNAEFLHGYLAAFELTDRDQAWSTWLAGATEADGDPAVRRLINWAWPVDLASRPAVPDDVAVLAVQLLGWLLTTTDRRVRDRATKAIVSIGERAPAALAEGLTRFHGVNDPYVTERLAAAACGVVLRNDSASASALIADAVDTLLGDCWPLHLLARDYARRVFAVAGARGWHGTQRNPPYGARWPVQTRTAEEIEQLAAPPDYAYSSVWHSLSGMGDFGRYILRPSLNDVESADAQALLRDAERAVFDRVLDLGWTPERFREIDSRRGWRDDNPVERVGKKYQWIGFYEVLGRITDNHPLSASSDSTQPQSYQYPEQLTWRDIDPTALARSTPSTPRERPWYSPAEARFPEGIPADYPDDVAGIPDPLDLIAVRDPQGTPWLTLATHPRWEQQIPPETEALGIPRREAWMHVTAYLVPVSAVPALQEWARGKDWQGRWMPDGPEIPNVLLGAYPDDPQWSAADGSIEYWNTHRGGPMPEGLALTAAGYAGTGTSRDASADAETTAWVPSRRLHDILGLAHGTDFTWNDASGTAIRDPSVAAGGPATLAMRRDLLPELTSAGLTLFWTVLIGNELNNTDPVSHPGSDYRWVSASASYFLSEGTINLISADAARCEPGPETERTLKWAPRKTDR
jgi:hypothetical protein